MLINKIIVCNCETDTDIELTIKPLDLLADALTWKYHVIDTLLSMGIEWWDIYTTTDKWLSSSEI